MGRGPASLMRGSGGVAQTGAYVCGGATARWCNADHGGLFRPARYRFFFLDVFLYSPPRIGVPSDGSQTGRPSPMAKFKRLTLHGTTDKVVVNLDLVLFVRPFERYSAIFFAEQHSMVVAESVNDILQAESLPNA
jgi:hypothetical protein